MANQESIPLWKDSQPDGDLVLVDRRFYVVRRRRRRLWLGLLGALVSIILVLALGRATWLSALGYFLIYREKPHQADVIQVLGGGGGERSAFGATLYHLGFAPTVVTSHLKQYDLCPGTAPRDRLAFCGVPAEDTLLLDNPLSTYEEALAARVLYEEMGVRRVLLVTDMYHSRRATLIFRHMFAGTEVEITPIPVEVPWFTPETWWHSERGIMAVFTEYAKLGWFLLGRQDTVESNP